MNVGCDVFQVDHHEVAAAIAIEVAARIDEAETPAVERLGSGVAERLVALLGLQLVAADEPLTFAAHSIDHSLAGRKWVGMLDRSRRCDEQIAHAICVEIGGLCCSARAGKSQIDGGLNGPGITHGRAVHNLQLAR